MRRKSVRTNKNCRIFAGLKYNALEFMFLYNYLIVNNLLVYKSVFRTLN